MKFVWCARYGPPLGTLERPGLDWHVVDQVLGEVLSAIGKRVAVVLTDEDVERMANAVYVIYEPLLDISIGINHVTRDSSITATDTLWNLPGMRRLADDVGAAAQREPIAALLEVAAAIDRLASTFQLTSPPRS